MGDFVEYIKNTILEGKSQDFVTDHNHEFLPKQDVDEKLKDEINFLSNMELLEYIEEALRGVTTR